MLCVDHRKSPMEYKYKSHRVTNNKENSSIGFNSFIDIGEMFYDPYAGNKSVTLKKMRA